jgi:hypothetical protein
VGYTGTPRPLPRLQEEGEAGPWDPLSVRILHGNTFPYRRGGAENSMHALAGLRSPPGAM